MYRFLLTPRWLGFALFVVVLSGLCLRLGLWQWHRLDHRLTTNSHVRELLKDAPTDVSRFVPADTSEWTSVTATGHFLDKQTLTVKYVIRDSGPGVEVVTPLQIAKGRAVLVDRGWLQTDNTGQRPGDVPPAPTGRVTVTGWWHPNNGAGPSATKPEGGQIRAISSTALAPALGVKLVSGYLGLTKQQPSAGDVLATATSPDLGQGPHFFYALQWWFFAALAPVGYVWFAITERRERAEAKPGS